MASAGRGGPDQVSALPLPLPQAPGGSGLPLLLLLLLLSAARAAAPTAPPGGGCRRGSRRRGR